MEKDQEASALAKAWRNTQRSLFHDRGLWAAHAGAEHAEEGYRWKLDRQEDPLRRWVCMWLAQMLKGQTQNLVS